MSSDKFVSRFRNLYGQAAKQRESYLDVKGSLSSGESNFVKANPKFFGYGLSTGGAPVIIRKLTDLGRVPANVPKLAVQKGKLTDFDFHPFINTMIATASDDCTVCVTQFPKDGLTQSINEANIVLKGHGKKVCLVNFNPGVNNIIGSTSYDTTTKIWDITTQSCVATYKGSKAVSYGFAWNDIGSLIALTAKDKKLRILDPRQAANDAIITDSFDGVKSSKVQFIPKFNFVAATGFSKDARRQIKIWDIKKADKPLKTIRIDGSGVLTAHYDDDLNILYVAGKGESTVLYWEIHNDNKLFYPLLDYRDGVPSKGGGWLPKRGLDVMKCEVQRYLKLTNKNSIVPVSFIVPRKSNDIFHDDIYPDCLSNKPSINPSQWLKGENAKLNRMSLDPDQRNDDDNVVQFEKKRTYDEILAENEKLKKQLANDKDMDVDNKEDIKEVDNEVDNQVNNEVKEENFDDLDIKLYYWYKYEGARLGGRAELTRLVLNIKQVKYTEPLSTVENPMETLKEVNFKQSNPTSNIYPQFALPILTTKKGLILSQSGVIENYLCELFGLIPNNIQDKYKAIQIRETVSDARSEGYKLERDKNTTNEQKKEFYDKRLKSFLDLFDKQLLMNNNGKEYFIGNKISIADISVYGFLKVLEVSNEEFYKNSVSDNLKAFRNRISNIDGIKKYESSDKCAKPRNQFLG